MTPASPLSPPSSPQRRRILTWHVHGSYLYYLAQGDRHDYILPVRSDRAGGYGGRSGHFRWPSNVIEVPVEALADEPIDALLFQSRRHYLEDQYAILTAEQRRLPRLYLEHDPPQEHPTNTRHVAADDAGVVIVHVTHFNDLMWDSGLAPTRVIPHGVPEPPASVRYTGELARGLVIVNNLPRRGRRLGRDVFERVRAEVPLDLVGMDAAALGGLGEVALDELPALIARYRFVFNPIRYTSLGLAVCEAMMAGAPILGLATTELVTVVENGVSGYVETDVERLIERMRALLDDPVEARRLSEGARLRARALFGLQRFLDDWDAVWPVAAALASEAPRKVEALAAGGR